MSQYLPVTPAGWLETRVDRVANINARIGWKALTAAEYQPEGYAFLATPNIKSRNIDFENVNYISKWRYDESPELKLQIGDVLLTKDGMTLGIANTVRELPCEATVNGSIALLRPFDIDPRFLYYSLVAAPLQAAMNAVKDGMDIMHLFQRDIKRLPLLLPPAEEQARISDFLDIETARIDSLTQMRSEQALKLSERWDASLTRLIEAHISGFGQIQLRRVLRSVVQGWSPQCDDVEAAPGEWAVLKTNAVSGGSFDPLAHKRLPTDVRPDLSLQIKDGDLLMTRGSGSAELVGMSCVARVEGRRLLLSDLLYRLRPHHGWHSEYLSIALQSKPIRGQMALLLRGQSGQTIKLRSEDIKNIPVPRLPSVEQKEFVDQQLSARRNQNELLQRIEKSLAALAERRQALITAAVTGQFDVTTARGVDLS